MKKLLSMFLALSMILTMLPVSAMAEEAHTTIGASGEIIAFAPLAETQKSVTTGTSIQDLELPKTLTATVRTAVIAGEEPLKDSEIPDEDTTADDLVVPATSSAIKAEVSEPQEAVEVIDPEWEETAQDIPVTWTSLPEYDMDTEGEYVFTSVIEGYTVNAELPKITVTVEAAMMRGLVTPMAVTEYKVWVGGVQVTSANANNVLGGETVSYNYNTNTLTLNNADITKAHIGWGGDTFCIYSQEIRPLTLKLISDNFIRGVDSVQSTYGIRCTGKLTIEGEGSLTVTPGKAYITNGFGNNHSSGILTEGGLTINDIILDIWGERYGLYEYRGGNITINGGTVTAYGGDVAIKGNLKTNGKKVSVMVGDEKPGHDWNGSELVTTYKYVKIELAPYFITDIAMTNAASVQVNTDLILEGTVSSDTDTNHTIIWSVENANGTGATINDGTFRATSPGNATVKASVTNGLTTSDDYTKTFDITVTAASLTGTANISNAAPRIGDVLKGSLDSGNNSGTLSYVWKADGTQVGTDESYTVVVADLGKTITLEISSSVQTGTITSTTTAAVLKKVAPSAPGAPTLASKTYNTVTLTANAAYEFSKDGTTWQTANVFNGLTASTAYTFYQRIAETVDTEASAASTRFSVTTNSKGGGGSSGSGSDGSSSDSSSPIIVTPPAPDNPNSFTQGEIKVPGTVDITDKTVTDAFENALAEAKKRGSEQNGITVVLRVDSGSKTSSNVTINLPKTVQDIIIAKKIVNTIVVVDNPDIRIGMDLTTVKEINRQANSDVNITATRRDSSKLTGDANKAIGSRPVFDLKVNYDSDKQVQNFGAGSVSVTIPYTLGTNEKAGNVQAVYVDDNGKVHWLVSSVYDSVEKILRFSTNHFSTYGIGYRMDAPSFTDIANHYRKDDIEFVAVRGLLGGTGTTTFEPDRAITRGMLVTALGRMANADTSVYTKSSFTDVKNDAYYMGYIEWANNMGIMSGIDGKFSADMAVTREHMAVILSNYAKAMGITLEKVYEEGSFADKSKISDYAKDPVKEMQMAGIITNRGNNLFDPTSTATRSDVSAVLRRFIERAAGSSIPEGWIMNDSGNWMYFEEGKAVTGKKEISGLIYEFNQYGETASSPGNPVYNTDKEQKEDKKEEKPKNPSTPSPVIYSTYRVKKGDSFWKISRKYKCNMYELAKINNKTIFDIIYPGEVLKIPKK